MLQQDVKQIITNLSSSTGVQPSDINTKVILRGDPGFNYGIQGRQVSFSHKGQQLARGYVSHHPGHPENDRIYAVSLLLPPLSNTNPLAPFSLEAVGNFWFNMVTTSYYFDSHPEFKYLLQDLRQSKRIPIQSLEFSEEPSVFREQDVGLVGSIQHWFGKPYEDRLCIKVDRKIQKYVPEAEEQSNKEHVCIHGDTAPFNPFDVSELSAVKITLHNNSYGHASERRLEEFLEGLPVPADGLEVGGELGGRGGQYGIARLKTPEDPFLETLILDPKKQENWAGMASLARRLEGMFTN